MKKVVWKINTKIRHFLLPVLFLHWTRSLERWVHFFHWIHLLLHGFEWDFFKYLENKYKNTTILVACFIFTLNSCFRKTISLFILHLSFQKMNLLLTFKVFILRANSLFTFKFLYWTCLLKRRVHFFTLNSSFEVGSTQQGSYIHNFVNMGMLCEV